MKLNKILFCLICFFLSFSAVNAREVESLYVIKDIPQENLGNVLNYYFSQNNYKIIRKNDFYILPPDNKNNTDYYEILLNQNGKDCYLYYFSNNDTSDFPLLLSKEIKKSHLKMKNIEALEINKIFKAKAVLLKQTSENSLSQAKNYDFGEAAELSFEQQNNIPIAIKHLESYTVEPVNTKTLKNANYVSVRSAKAKHIPSIVANSETNKTPTLKGAVVTVASGTAFNATIESAISSASMAQSDRITAVLGEDLRYNGFLIFPSGTILYGSAIKANAASYGYGNGSLDLIFDQALTPNGHKINISVDKISYTKNSERAVNITKNVAMGAGLGILSGLLSAAYTGNYQQALITGASLGAAGGGIYAATRKGEEIEIPEGTVLNLRLNQPINISPYN